MKLYWRGGACSTLVNSEESTPGIRRRIKVKGKVIPLQARFGPEGG